MRSFTPARLMLAVVAALGGCVMLGLFSVKRSLDAIEQPQLTSVREGFATRTIPMAASNLKPGTIIRKDDIGSGPWPMRDVRGDILLSERLIVGRVVQKEIKSATPIHAGSLVRPGEYSKEYVGVP